MNNSPHINLHGTLILITLFQDGLIIAADRDVDLGNKIVTGQEKVYKFASQGFFAVCGRPRIVIRADPTKDVFNVATIVSDFFSNYKQEEGRDFWNDLEERLLEEFRTYLSTIEFRHWPEEDKQNNKLFYKIVFVYKSDEERIGLTEFSFRYGRKDPPELSMEIIHGWFEGLYLAYGYTQSAYGLREGRSPKLKELSTDPVFAPFMDKRATPDGITFEQALNFTQGVMIVSNALNPAPFKVSRECSYAIIKGNHSN